jgi:hypothetical protein
MQRLYHLNFDICNILRITVLLQSERSHLVISLVVLPSHVFKFTTLLSQERSNVCIGWTPVRKCTHPCGPNRGPANTSWFMGHVSWFMVSFYCGLSQPMTCTIHSGLLGLSAAPTHGGPPAS